MRISTLIKELVVAVLLASGAGVVAPGAVLPSVAKQSCATWSADQQMDEGGTVLTATVCADEADSSPGLTIQCFDKVNVRYDLGTKEPTELQPGMSARFTFASGTTAVTKKFDYEDMDSMFAAYLPQTDPLLALLKTGDRLTVTDAAGKFRPHSFSLSGSTAAIGKVMAACGKAASAGD